MFRHSPPPAAACTSVTLFMRFTNKPVSGGAGLLVLALALQILTGCSATRETVSPVAVPAKGTARVDVPAHGDATPSRRPPSPHAARIESLLRSEIAGWEGTQHVFGGVDKNGVDCSAFVMCIYRDALNVGLPRSTYEQVEMGIAVSQEELVPGDLVFFKPSRSNHVGIYLGGGRFAHASESQGVMISDLSDRYWQRSWWTARRIIEAPRPSPLPPLVARTNKRRPAASKDSAHAPASTEPEEVDSGMEARRSGW